MGMRLPEVVLAETVEEAIRSLSRRGAYALAGATDLLLGLRQGEIAPRVLVNLKHVPGLAGVRRVRGAIRIGALTRVADLIGDEIVLEELPLLAEVARGFGSVQIRNLATIGGNLCNAAPSADLAPPLLALDARAEIEGPKGPREVELTEFFRGANKTALRRAELLTAIFVPRPRAGAGTAYAKLGGRRAMDLAAVSAAARVELAPNGVRCRTARIALGAVAPTPRRACRAEAVLEGSEICSEAIEEAAAAAAAQTRPISDVRASAKYRRQMTRVCVRRALTEALRRARKERKR
jgi:carbon-monoxide dehydrogenase medium subunit